jgi:hypothetical protein
MTSSISPSLEKVQPSVARQQQPSHPVEIATQLLREVVGGSPKGGWGSVDAAAVADPFLSPKGGW